VAFSLAVCHNNKEVIFAGTFNKLLRYDGFRWQTVSTISGHDAPVTGLVMDTACNNVFASVFGVGVYCGQSQIGIWNWNLLVGDQSVATDLRDVALVGNRLFVAGSFGIYYWDNGWKTTNAPSSRVMDLSVFDPLNNSGRIYAAVWLEDEIWTNSNAASNPTGWQDARSTRPAI
jgi:hypothetical protein